MLTVYRYIVVRAIPGKRGVPKLWNCALRAQNQWFRNAALARGMVHMSF